MNPIEITYISEFTRAPSNDLGDILGKFRVKIHSVIACDMRNIQTKPFLTCECEIIIPAIFKGTF